MQSKKNQIVSVELIDSGYFDVVGFAKLNSDNECTVNEVDAYGIADGVTYMSVNDITALEFMSGDETRRMRLWNCEEKN